VGFRMSRAEDTTVQGNTVTGAATGFSLTGSGNTIDGNHTVATSTGFSLGDSENLSPDNAFRTVDNTLRGNSVEDAVVGMLGFAAGPGNTFADNNGFAIGPIMVITEDTTLDADHVGSVVIAADGVTLDCDGYEVFGREQQRFEQIVYGVGIEIRDHSNVTVENCDVTGFEVGIGLWEAHDNTIRNNTIGTSVAGIWLMQSNDNDVLSNTMPGRAAGIASNLTAHMVLTESRRNTIKTNKAADAGILLRRAHRNLMEDNSVSGVFLDRSNGNTALGNDTRGVNLDRSDRNVVEGNTCEQVWLTRSSKNIVEGNTASRFGLSGESADNRLADNIASGDRFGYSINGGSHHNHFQDNRATDSKVGFQLRNAHENRFEGNDATGTEEALRMNDSATGNTFTDNVGF